MSILRGRGSAREGSYFKSEQEDELSAYRKRRIREGAIAPDPERVLIPGETDPRGRERAWVSDTKLAEIHAQEARVTAPPDVLRRRVSTQMPPISTAGNAAGRGAMHGTYRIPSTRIAKWGGLDSIRAAAEEERRHAIPAETEAMRKTRAVANKALAAGTRALLYGSVAAAAGVVGGGFVASAALDVRSSDDLRALLQRVAGPSVERARRSLAPWREWMEGGDGGGGSGGGGGGGLRWIEESTVVRDLRRKFRMRRPDEAPSSR